MIFTNNIPSPVKNFCLLFIPLILCGVCLHGCAPVLTSPEEYVKKSSSLEQTGDISAAIEELKVALTVDPSNTSAQEQLKRLCAIRDNDAEKHYKAGLTLKESDPPAATREFLTALRIKPDFQSAVDELKNQHLAIAESKLRSRAIVRGEGTKKKGEEDEAVEEESNYLGLAISLYENGEYQAAINELLKVKTKYPRNTDIIKYLNLSYYNLGVYYYNKRDYMKALSMFTKVKKGFENTEPYIKKTRIMLKNLADEFYRAGLKFYREQKLNEAIMKWNTVLEIEPNHQKAKEYIYKSKKLLEALKQ
jgi:tetratricopeptide (TPR) repeat protein